MKLKAYQTVCVECGGLFDAYSEFIHKPTCLPCIETRWLNYIKPKSPWEAIFGSKL